MMRPILDSQTSLTQRRLNPDIPIHSFGRHQQTLARDTSSSNKKGHTSSSFGYKEIICDNSD